MKIIGFIPFIAFFNSMALAGEVIIWGQNVEKATLQDPDFSTNSVAFNGQIATNAISIAGESSRAFMLLGDGSVRSWGFSNQATILTSLSNITAVSSGNSHTLALKNDGTIFGVGFNADGEATGIATQKSPYLSSGIVTLRSEVLNNVTTVAAGKAHSLALKKDGTVLGWGSIGKTLNFSNIVTIAAARAWAGWDVALRSDGTVLEWQAHSSEPPLIHSNLTDVISVASGAYHRLALKKDGTVVAWGENQYHQVDVPTGLDNVIAIACGDYHSIALKKDGTIVAWGDNSFHQTDVPQGLNGVIAIAAGRSFSMAVTTNRSFAEKFQRK